MPQELTLETSPGVHQVVERGADIQFTNNQIVDLILLQFEGIKKELAGLTVEIRQISNRLTEVENTYIRQVETTQKLRHTIKTLQSKTEDLDDRSRRNNVRVVGLPKTSEYTDFIQFASTTLPNILGMTVQEGKIAVERAYRTGPNKLDIDSRNCPRMMIRYLNFQDKVAIMRQYRKNNPLIIEGRKVLMFQDFSADTSAKRKEMSPYCSGLIKAGMKAILRYPAKLVVVGKETQIVLSSPDEAKAYCNKNKIYT